MKEPFPLLDRALWVYMTSQLQDNFISEYEAVILSLLVVPPFL